MNFTQPTQNERYQIYALKEADPRQCEITSILGRNPATTSRELARHCGLRSYRPKQAQKLAVARTTPSSH